jgi:hypothetical protein
MTRHSAIVGLMIVLGHFSLLILVIALWLRYPTGFLFGEMVTAIGIIGPLFAAYTTVIINVILRTRHERVEADRGNGFSRGMSIALPILFAAIVGRIIWCWTFKIGFTDFEQFKVALGSIEGVFGLYVGQFIYGIFKQVR